MPEHDAAFAANRANWDERAAVHAASPAYAVDRFVADPGFLSEVVRFDRPPHSVVHCWNHGIGEIVTALLPAGLTITRFVEHDSVPWNALPGQMQRGDDGEWRLADRPERLAASYTLEAVAPR